MISSLVRGARDGAAFLARQRLLAGRMQTMPVSGYREKSNMLPFL
jgi:hypothetical protein